MSNDRYRRIRDALAMGPTTGPWVAIQNPEWPNAKYGITSDPSKDWVAAVNSGVASVSGEANAHHIAACDPDTIRELLAERDQLAAALEAAREDAERYRWLRDRMAAEEITDETYARLALRTVGPIAKRPADSDYCDELDAAIDQARGKGGQEVES